MDIFDEIKYFMLNTTFECIPINVVWLWLDKAYP